MGSRYFTRPENAISKAEEFMKVGKPARALDTLYDVIKSKKRNHNYSEKLIEEIMFKYLELCVELKKSHVAKEGLFQYRNMCQSVNVASLNAVVQGYLTLAEQRTDAAKKESVDKVEVDDLDNLATPEMIMLSAVSGEGAQDRSDRTILMPWVKFLWESYCQCLELLRTNSRVERLYHNIAQQAFKFCLKYQRKTEFRKLCDKLRNHLDLIIKQQNPTANSINLNNSETQQMNLDTRLVQLDAAINMELWQEAYKAVEDIHGLMSLSKKVFQPKMMANYYQKLALVFWKSGNYLFHAAAVFKHFQLTREMKKNISAEELARMAGRVLAACLCAPLPSQHPEFDRFIETDRSPAEKMARLAVLLALSQPPTRVSLLKDCVRFGVVTAAAPELQDLYNWLEVDFHPLSLCKKVDDRLKAFDEENSDFSSLSIYVDPLREMTLVRLLKQVAQVYQSLSMSRLLELATFTTHHHLERLIVECARNNDMQVRIDHRTRNIHFGTDLTESQRTDLPEGPHVQSMPSEQVRTQLMRMMTVLDGSLKVIHPNRNKVESEELRKKIVDAYHQSKTREHLRLLGRHELIEKRKEWLEKCSNDQAQERMKAQELKEKEKKKQEEARLKLELEEREKRRRENEIKDIQAKHVQDKINQLKNTEFGKKVLDKLDEEEIAKMDSDEIMAKQVEELEREKKELQVRLKAQEKKVDHLERAKRLEEIPLLKEQHEDMKAERKQVWEEQEVERIEKEKLQRETDVENKARMSRMQEEKNKYLETLLKERKNVFDKKLKEFEVMYKEEREKRLAHRREERKEERRRKWIREMEEEEQRRRDEEAKRKREEEERLEEERRIAEAEEDERRNRERDAVAEKTRQREREMEERLEAERRQREEEAASARGQESRVGGGGRGGFGGGGEKDDWRRGGGGGGGNDDEPGGARDRGGDRDSGRGGVWRGGGGSWREKNKEDEWGPRNPRREEPRREEGGGGGMWRRDDGGRSPPRRGGSPGGPRRGGSPPRRGSPSRGGPPDRRGSPSRGGPPPARGGGSPSRRSPDRGSWRRDGPPPQRDMSPRRDGGGFGRHDDRGPPRRDDRPPRGGGYDRRDEDPRGPPRRRSPDGGGGGGSWRKSNRGGGDDDGPSDWRRGGAPPPRRGDDRGPPPRRDDRGGPRRDDDDRKPPPPPTTARKDDDGWSTVSGKR